MGTPPVSRRLRLMALIRLPSLPILPFVIMPRTLVHPRHTQAQAPHTAVPYPLTHKGGDGGRWSGWGGLGWVEARERPLFCPPILVLPRPHHARPGAS